MGSTSLPAPPPNFGFGVVKLGFLRRTASRCLLHSKDHPVPPSPEQGDAGRAAICPSTARPYLWTASLAVLPQLCALGLNSRLDQDNHLQNSGEYLLWDGLFAAPFRDQRQHAGRYQAQHCADNPVQITRATVVG